MKSQHQISIQACLLGPGFRRVRSSKFHISTIVKKRERGQDAVAASLCLSRQWAENIWIRIKLGVPDKTAVVLQSHREGFSVQ